MKNSFEDTMKELARMREQIDMIHSLIISEDQAPEVEDTEMFTFTKEQLVIYSGHLVDRIVKQVMEAIRNTDIDEDDVVDLEFTSYNLIEVNLDTDKIMDEFESTIQNEIGIESDAIEEEMLSILKMMKNHQ
jgi:hypothetical protein